LGEAQYLEVPQASSREGWHDMRDFAESLDDVLARRLLDAIRGKGAFQSFKYALGFDPEVRRQWFAFKQERLRARIRLWLAAQGIAVEDTQV
jgi:hypothetical protein